MAKKPFHPKELLDIVQRSSVLDPDVSLALEHVLLDAVEREERERPKKPSLESIERGCREVSRDNHVYFMHVLLAADIIKAVREARDWKPRSRLESAVLSSLQITSQQWLTVASAIADHA